MESCSGSGSSSKKKEEATLVSKPELGSPPETICSRQIGQNVASTSGAGFNLRSSFLAMGFLPSLVDKVIEEKGEDDVDLLLETLFAYSGLQKSNSDSSESLDDLFDDGKNGNSPPAHGTNCHPLKAAHKSNCESSDSLDNLFGDIEDESSHPVSSIRNPKKESDAYYDEKRAFLLSMNFSLSEVIFAMDKLGQETHVNELVDFIIAAQMAENFEKDAEDAAHVNREKPEESNSEALFGTMDMTLRLLEMGFSENDVSAAIEKHGSELPISELADLIFVDQIAATGIKKEVVDPTAPSHTDQTHTGFDKSFGRGMDNGFLHNFVDTSLVKQEEECGLEATIGPGEFWFEETRKAKKPKQEYIDDSSSSVDPSWLEDRKEDVSRVPFSYKNKPDRPDGYDIARPIKPLARKNLDRAVSKPPYFFYGNVVNVSKDSWSKISQFLYALEPEFVNAQFFSALNRKEGYVHNLPSENRVHILLKSPMTIQDAMPDTKKWWPPWDPRKQLSCISIETNGVTQLCERLGNIVVSSGGLPSVEQQKNILHHCQTLNLVWVGKYKLGPLEPPHLENILGYPSDHTQFLESNRTERLLSLKYSFQTDTLGHHLSVLKSLFPRGLSMLSIFSGTGGAEVSLHRLGIHLKYVVSVETCEAKQRILNRWWHRSGQTGELVQIEDIQKLTTNRLASLMEKAGGFDFIICQNPCTQTSRSLKNAADDESAAGFDFSMFCEFVRVLQRVRTMSGGRR